MNSSHFENEKEIIAYFDWFVPSPPKPALVITIPNENEVYFNRKLCEQIPKQIKIGVNSNGAKLGLLEFNEGYHIPKNGMIKASELIDEIQKRGVRLPAT